MARDRGDGDEADVADRRGPSAFEELHPPAPGDAVRRPPADLRLALRPPEALDPAPASRRADAATVPRRADAVDASRRADAATLGVTGGDGWTPDPAWAAEEAWDDPDPARARAGTPPLSEHFPGDVDALWPPRRARSGPAPQATPGDRRPDALDWSHETSREEASHADDPRDDPRDDDHAQDPGDGRTALGADDPDAALAGPGARHRMDEGLDAHPPAVGGLRRSGAEGLARAGAPSETGPGRTRADRRALRPDETRATRAPHAAAAGRPEDPPPPLPAADAPSPDAAGAVRAALAARRAAAAEDAANEDAADDAANGAAHEDHHPTARRRDARRAASLPHRPPAGAAWPDDDDDEPEVLRLDRPAPPLADPSREDPPRNAAAMAPARHPPAPGRAQAIPGPAPALGLSPCPGPGEALVEIEAWALEADGAGGARLAPWQAAGRLLALGPPADDAAARPRRPPPETGERVALVPARPCDACPACRDGRRDHCLAPLAPAQGPAPDPSGPPPARLMVAAAALAPVGDAPAEAAALLGPVARAIWTLERLGPLLGRSVLICGAGPDAALLALCAQAAGAGRIAALDGAAAALARMRRLGADELLDPARDAAGVAAACAPPGRFDAAADTTGAAAALLLAAEALRPGGALALLRTGATPPAARVAARGLRVLGAAPAAPPVEPARLLIAAGRLAPERAVTHALPPDRLARARTLAADPAQALQVMIRAPERRADMDATGATAGTP